MNKTILISIAVAGLVAACGQTSDSAEGDNTVGPAVSTSESPRNTAVDTTPTTGETTQTPGANSFTEGQAQAAITAAGYTDVGPLMQNEAGLWQGSAMKAGEKVTVSVDYKGAVTPQ